MRWGISLIALCLSVSGCSEKRPQVVVYVSTDEAIAREVLDAFTSQTGVQVLMVGDTEARKTFGLVDRLKNERHAPIADVFWSSEGIGMIMLESAGCLAQHVSEASMDWPEQWRSPDGRWYAFSPRPRVLVFDPEMVSATALPATWIDLQDPRWRNQIAVADPRFGTTGGHLAAMRSWMGASLWSAWIDAMAAQNLLILPGGNAAVVDAVRRGEVMLGATDADDVYAANQEGASLAFTPLRHGSLPGEGAMLMPNTVAILAGAPHPREAALLMDWLLSENVARLLAESVSGNVPLQPSLQEAYPHLQIEDPLAFNLPDVAGMYPSAVDEVVESWREASVGAR